MTQLRRAEHRTILVVDVERFGDRRQTNANQVAVRDGMYGALRQTFGDVGISWDECRQEDRGDGIFFLAPPAIHKGLFVESFAQYLVKAPREHNASHSEP
jgi:hypothetical protein